ncbi:HET-like protein [Mycena venus]|uniref:HET-like protein n=1 Tax=Mycena venus TaxID=2733690 RepID=A0A8H6YXI8_9AGAR|nr:HET-like protein [Mycena venus]
MSGGGTVASSSALRISVYEVYRTDDICISAKLEDPPEGVATYLLASTPEFHIASTSVKQLSEKDPALSNISADLETAQKVGKEKLSDSREELTTGNIQIKVEKMMGGIGGYGGSATHGAGTGKTIVSSMIIEQLFEEQVQPTNNNPIAIVYFYFDFADSAMQSIEHALRRLVLQLSRQSPVPHEILNQYYESHQGQKVPSYLELLAILERLLRAIGRTYLVLDALDECADHDRVMDFIARISACLDVQLHILVTSQSRNVFEKTFLLLKTLSRITIQADTTSDDIRLYISKELASKNELQLWNSEWAHITNYITYKSAGMFRLAYCLLEQLKECARLDDLQMALDALPDNLHDIYARTISSVPKKHLLDVQRLLHWLTFSQRALTLVELEDTISFDFSDPAHIKFAPHRRPKRGFFIKWLSVLVSIKPPYPWERVLDSDGFYYGDCTVSLAHSSVQDYLLLEQESHPSWCNSCSVHVTEKGAHQLIAQTCISYLLHLADNDFNATVLLNYPLAIYANMNWSYHLLCCPDHAILSNLTMHLLEVGSSQYTALNQLEQWNWTPDQFSLIDGPPLCLCARLGYIEGVKYLLDRGADVNAEGTNGAALQLASENSHIEIIHLLLEKGADVNAMVHGGTALQRASANGDLEIVHLLLEKGADVDAIHPRFYSALHQASLHGHLMTVRLLLEKEIISLLLENGANVNIMDEECFSALQLALWNGNIEAVCLLLDNGADVNAAVGSNYSALQLASMLGRIDIVHLLLEKGADVNVNTGRTPLQLASMQDHTEIAHLLLEKGAEVNALDEDYFSALQLASGYGQVKTVRLLLDNGADVNAAVGSNYSALQLASMQGRVDIIHLLLEKGADINVNIGRTPLQLALLQGHTQIVHFLLDKGADVNVHVGYGTVLEPPRKERNNEIVRLLLEKLLLEKGTDINDELIRTVTALKNASSSDDTRIIRLLLEKGADVNATGMNGTVLQLASVQGHIEIVGLLLEKGADVNAKGRHGTALQLASTKHDIQIVRVLLEKGADVDANGERGTALQLASKHGHIGIVHLLLEKGADVEATGGNIVTPLQLASMNGHIEVVKILLEKGAVPTDLEEWRGTAETAPTDLEEWGGTAETTVDDWPESDTSSWMSALQGFPE